MKNNGLICLFVVITMLCSFGTVASADIADFTLSMTSDKINMNVSENLVFEGSSDVESANIDAFVSVADSNGNIVPVSIYVSGTTVTIDPTETLSEASTYIIRFHDALHDTSGNVLTGQKAFAVKTVYPQEVILYTEESGIGENYEDSNAGDSGRTSGGVLGYNNQKTRFVDSWASFIPKLPRGSYKVSYWRSFRADIQSSQCSDALVELYSGSEVTQVGTMNLTVASGGWIDLGVFDLTGAADEYFKVSRGANGGTLRVSAMKFEYMGSGSFDLIEINHPQDLSSVSTNLNVIAKFSGTADIASFDNVCIRNSSGEEVAVNAYPVNDTEVLLVASEVLECNTSYTLEISGVKSLEGNPISEKEPISFTTKEYSASIPKIIGAGGELTVNTSISGVDKAALLSVWTDSDGYVKEIDADEKEINEDVVLETVISSNITDGAKLNTLVLHELSSLKPIENSEIGNTVSLTDMSFNENTNTVNISGTVSQIIEGSQLIIAMLKKNTTKITAENLYYFNVTELCSNSFDAEILLPFDVEGGAYDIYVGGTGIDDPAYYPFYYISDDTIEAARVLLNGATEETIQKILIENYRELGLDKEMVDIFKEFSEDENKANENSAYSKISNIMLGGKPYDTVESAAKLFNETTMLCAVQSLDASRIQDIVERRSDLLGIYIKEQINPIPDGSIILSDYKNIGNTAAIYTAVKNSEYNNLDTFKTVLEREYAMVLLDSAVWGEIEDILIKYNSKYFNLNLAEYDNLSNKKKEQVLRSMSDKDLSTKSKIAAEYAAALKAATNTGSSSAKSPGGGKGTLAFDPELETSKVYPEKLYEQPADEKTIEFTDLEGVEWAIDSIKELSEKGVISGYDDGRFYPNNAIKREEFVKILIGAFELLDISANSEFVDVDEDNWSYYYVSSAKELGIVNGVSDVEFGYGSLISRQEMAVMLARALEKLEISVPDVKPIINFRDAESIDEYAVDAVEKMYKAGIMNGIGDGVFDPNGMATRAMAAKVISAAMKFLNQ